MKIISVLISNDQHAFMKIHGGITKLTREAIDEKLSRMIIPDMKDVFKIVEMVCNCPTDWVSNKTRRREYVAPRQLAMYIMQTKLCMSQSSAGAYFGLDHATARHAREKCLDSLDTQDQVLYAAVFKIDKMYENMNSYEN